MSVKTTAINKYNVAVTSQSGKIGNVRYVQKYGETYVRSAVNGKKTNPRTDSQMIQRLKWASLSTLWHLFKGNLRNSFQFKETNQSDYNAFMQMNHGKGVYFTKTEKQAGAQVMLPVMVSNGSLPAIAETLSSGKVVTGIALGNYDPSGALVNELSEAIVNNNEDWEYGDELAIFYATNVVLASVPKVIMSCKRITLDPTDTRDVEQVLPPNYVLSVNNHLGTATLPDGFAICYIHSRKSENGLEVSTQSMVCKNATLIATYGSNEHFELARDSYGKSSNSFLTPETNADSPAGPLFTINVTCEDDQEGQIKINNGTAKASDAIEVHEGEIVNLTALPRQGYGFRFWNREEGTPAEMSIVADPNVTNYKAYFEEL